MIEVIVGAVVLAILAVLGFAIYKSLTYIGPTEVGLPIKRFGAKLNPGNVIAFAGEAGYQADLMMPGWRFGLWPIYRVDKYPWVQVPAGEIGVVIAQVGDHLPIGAKSAEYRASFGDFRDVREF